MTRPASKRLIGFHADKLLELIAGKQLVFDENTWQFLHLIARFGDYSSSIFLNKSDPDEMILVKAKEHNAILLTMDRPLYRLATAEGVKSILLWQAKIRANEETTNPEVVIVTKKGKGLVVTAFTLRTNFT